MPILLLVKKKPCLFYLWRTYSYAPGFWWSPHLSFSATFCGATARASHPRFRIGYVALLWPEHLCFFRMFRLNRSVLPSLTWMVTTMTSTVLSAIGAQSILYFMIKYLFMDIFTGLDKIPNVLFPWKILINLPKIEIGAYGRMENS